MFLMSYISEVTECMSVGVLHIDERDFCPHCVIKYSIPSNKLSVKGAKFLVIPNGRI